LIEAQNMEEYELRNHRKLTDLIKAHGVSNIAFKFLLPVWKRAELLRSNVARQLET
jgi:hypothetical protein